MKLFVINIFLRVGVGWGTSTLHASSDNDRDLFPSVLRSQTIHNCALYMVKSPFVYRELLAQILRADSAPSLDLRQKDIIKRTKCSKFKRQLLMNASESLNTSNHQKAARLVFCYIHLFWCFCPVVKRNRGFLALMPRCYNRSLHVDLLHN